MPEQTDSRRYAITGAWSGKVLALDAHLDTAQRQADAYRSRVDLAALEVGETVNVTDTIPNTGTGVNITRTG